MQKEKSPIENRWIWPFELEAQIGSGGMGVVYRARFVKNDRRVALKLLPTDIANNATIAARFERELEILKDLRHPNIVHCFGGTCEGARRFYAMELVEGGTIESVLKDKGRIPYARVVDYALELCSALAYAHSRGVIHRDIKPGNLLLTKDGKVKLSDFGLALMAAGNKLTQAGKTMGTLLYMAPEQIRGNPPISRKTDLYAMGCLLFEMLTGKTPFFGEAAGEILHQHIHTPAPKLSTILRDCPQELEDIISDLLEKDPENRPDDAYVVAQRLKNIEQGVTVRRARSDFGAGNQPTKSIIVDRAVLKAQAETTPKRPALEPLPSTAETEFPFRSFVLAGVLLLAAWRLSLMFTIPALSPDNPYDRTEDLLIELLRDPDPAVRLAATRTLGAVGPAARLSVRELADRLEDPDEKVRGEAVTALGKLGREAIPVIPQIVKTGQQDESQQVRTQASDLNTKLSRGDFSQAVVPRPRRSPFMMLMLGLCVVMAGAAMWVLVERPLG